MADTAHGVGAHAFQTNGSSGGGGVEQRVQVAV